MMMTFGKIEEEYSRFEDSAILLQSCPYDGTSTWGKGADKAFGALMEASNHMELYDIETGTEVYRKGIHILPELRPEGNPEQVFRQIYRNTKELLRHDRFLTFIGGEHSVSMGIIKAFYEKYKYLTVLQLDAHTDLRPCYQGSAYNHACAMHDASRNARLIQAGIRSMDRSELDYFEPSRCVYAREMQDNDDWIDRIVSLLGGDVYISLDVDVFDPSVMPSTGTPEPGGMTWYQLIKLLRRVFAAANVRGFDIVEFAPLENRRADAFMLVKLYYKMLSYKYYG